MMTQEQMVNVLKGIKEDYTTCRNRSDEWEKPRYDPQIEALDAAIMMAQRTASTIKKVNETVLNNNRTFWED